MGSSGAVGICKGLGIWRERSGFGSKGVACKVWFEGLEGHFGANVEMGSEETERCG